MPDECLRDPDDVHVKLDQMEARAREVARQQARVWWDATLAGELIDMSALQSEVIDALTDQTLADQADAWQDELLQALPTPELRTTLHLFDDYKGGVMGNACLDAGFLLGVQIGLLLRQPPLVSAARGLE